MSQADKSNVKGNDLDKNKQSKNDLFQDVFFDLIEMRQLYKDAERFLLSKDIKYSSIKHLNDDDLLKNLISMVLLNNWLDNHYQEKFVKILLLLSYQSQLHILIFLRDKLIANDVYRENFQRFNEYDFVKNVEKALFDIFYIKENDDIAFLSVIKIFTNIIGNKTFDYHDINLKIKNLSQLFKVKEQYTSLFNENQYFSKEQQNEQGNQARSLNNQRERVREESRGVNHNSYIANKATSNKSNDENREVIRNVNKLSGLILSGTDINEETLLFLEKDKNQRFFNALNILLYKKMLSLFVKDNITQEENKNIHHIRSNNNNEKDLENAITYFLKHYYSLNEFKNCLRFIMMFKKFINDIEKSENLIIFNKKIIHLFQQKNGEVKNGFLKRSSNKDIERKFEYIKRLFDIDEIMAMQSSIKERTNDLDDKFNGRSRHVHNNNISDNDRYQQDRYEKDDIDWRSKESDRYFSPNGLGNEGRENRFERNRMTDGDVLEKGIENFFKTQKWSVVFIRERNKERLSERVLDFYFENISRHDFLSFSENLQEKTQALAIFFDRLRENDKTVFIEILSKKCYSEKTFEYDRQDKPSIENFSKLVRFFLEKSNLQTNEHNNIKYSQERDVKKIKEEQNKGYLRNLVIQAFAGEL